MKRLNISRTVLILWVIGLFLTSLVPILNRYYPMPDAVRGFMMGLGLCIEVIALTKMTRDRSKRACG